MEWWSIACLVKCGTKWSLFLQGSVGLLIFNFVFVRIIFGEQKYRTPARERDKKISPVSVVEAAQPGFKSPSFKPI